MTTDTLPARPAAASLIDPVLEEKAWAHAGTGRYYVPQGLTGYLLGRVLDIVIVTAVTFGLTKAVDVLAHSATLMAAEWNVRDVLPPNYG